MSIFVYALIIAQNGIESMKNFPDSNMFSIAGETVLNSYSASLSGADALAPTSAECLFLAVFASPASNTARNALTKSAASFGYPASKCLFLDASALPALAASPAQTGEPTQGQSQAQPQVQSQAPARVQAQTCAGENQNPTSGAEERAARELFAAIEGLDPRVLVLADAHSAQLAAHAYTMKSCVPRIDYLKPFRLLGRRCLAFESFEALLATPENKQRAWHALKMLFA